MKNNLKAIGILICLSIFGYGVYFVSSVLTKVNEVKGVEIETEIAEQQEELVEEVIWEDIEPVEGTCPECEVSVLGDTDTMTCEDVLNELVTTPVLYDGSSNVNFASGESSGDRVSKNAKIKVQEVKVPAVLLAGPTQVKDSNKIPSLESASYSAAGDIFDIDYGRKLVAPSAGKEYDSKVLGSVYKEPFGSKTEMKFAQIEEAGPEADINVETDEESICLNCQDSNYNPDRSNNIAETVNATMSIPGGQKFAPQDEEPYLTEDSGLFADLPEAAVEIGCQRKSPILSFNLIANISASLFNHCNTPDDEGNYPDDCIKVENIVIRTNSFFGNYEKCEEEGKCTNTLLSRRSLSSLSPVSASSYDQDFLVTTPCKVSVDGKTYNVKCLWDVSYIAKDYYYKWQNSHPGADFPVWTVFWQAIEDDILGRESDLRAV